MRDRFLFFVGICEGGDGDEDAGGEVFRWGIFRAGVSVGRCGYFVYGLRGRGWGGRTLGGSMEDFFVYGLWGRGRGWMAISGSGAGFRFRHVVCEQ